MASLPPPGVYFHSHPTIETVLVGADGVTVTIRYKDGAPAAPLRIVGNSLGQFELVASIRGKYVWQKKDNNAVQAIWTAADSAKRPRDNGSELPQGTAEGNSSKRTKTGAASELTEQDRKDLEPMGRGHYENTLRKAERLMDDVHDMDPWRRNEEAHCEECRREVRAFLKKDAKSRGATVVLQRVCAIVGVIGDGAGRSEGWKRSYDCDFAADELKNTAKIIRSSIGTLKKRRLRPHLAAIKPELEEALENLQNFGGIYWDEIEKIQIEFEKWLDTI